MKKISIILSALLALTISTATYAQDAPPAPPSSHGESGNKEGGGAPIGGGLFILLGLGAAYGGKKLYDLKKEKLEE